MINFFIFLNNQIHRILVALGLRHDRMFWGIVYDSVSKQPLDPAIVKLVDAKSGKVFQSSVTDIAGRYNFLAYPGKFIILVKKSNYSFPSKIVKGGEDGLYSNLYFGEFFELFGDSEVIPFNIPMDPVKLDWNQTAKNKVVNFHPWTNYLISRLTRIFFWFGFIFFCLMQFTYQTPLVYGVLALYFFIFLLLLVTPKPRLWGRIVFKKIVNDFGRVVVELSYHSMPGVIVAKADVFPDGKFFLRINSGSYLLNIKTWDKEGVAKVLKSVPVHIGPLQVINKNFVL